MKPEMSPFRSLESAYRDAVSRTTVVGKRAHIKICRCGNVMLGLHYTVHTGPSEAWYEWNTRLAATKEAATEVLKAATRIEFEKVMGCVPRENLRFDSGVDWNEQ